jgi:predicted ATPase/DNA-binding SARP family transcriptional activator
VGGGILEDASYKEDRAMPDGGPPLEAHVSYSRQYRRCAKPGCPSCGEGGPGHGPYWYAYWREGGRQRSRYLGKNPPLGAMAQTPAATRPPAPAGKRSAPERVPASPEPVRAAAAAAAPTLRVRALGGLAVWRGGLDLRVETWRPRSAVALLACLLGAPGRRLRREELAERLWPEGEPGAGLRNLRVAVHHLRRLLGEAGTSEGYLLQDGEFLRLVPVPDHERATDWLDAAAFEQAAAAALAGRDAGACRAALALYGGEYLPEEPYAEWAAATREALAGRRLALLLHLALLCRAAGEEAETERRLREVLAADPCQEGAGAALMEVLAAQGRRGEALRVYQQVATALDRELGLGPQATLEGLRARLLTEAAPVAANFAPRLRLPGRPTNLPAPTSGFVGRTWELGEVRRLLGEARLLTLTGPGGCGKSRLAQEAAGVLLGEYPDGVWLVELAALADPALVPGAVATALGVAEPVGRPLLEVLVAFLAPRAPLLLLDNCEHLVEACAALAATLLGACPAMRILATSRQALGLAGEVTWLVPALAYPAAEAAASPAELAGYEAVQLLVARARAHRPAFALSEANAEAVARVCRQLEGIPLALELAAARLEALTVGEIAGRLGDRLSLLGGGGRAVLPRHRTLRATLDWSWGLLGARERALLRRLAVFAGGWTLEAAEAVGAGEGIAAEGVLDWLAGLVSKSLVQVEEREGRSRYRLLEMVRQYVSEQLRASGEEEAVHGRHLAWCQGLAERAEPELTGPEQGAWLARLETEHDNLRAALRWAVTQDRPQGLHLAGKLWRFWEVHGHLREGGTWLESLYTDEAPLATRAAARAGIAWLAYKRGDLTGALAWAEESVALWRQAGMPLPLARALNNLAAIESDCDHEVRASALYEECIPLYREAGDPWGMAGALNNLGTIALGNADYEAAAVNLDEALALIRRVGDQRVLSIVLVNSAEVACGRGNPQQALTLLREGLGLAEDIGDRELIAYILEGMARAHGTSKGWAETAWLGAMADALRRALGAPPPPADAAAVADAMRAARETLGEARFAGLLASGREAVGACERTGRPDYHLLVSGLPGDI